MRKTPEEFAGSSSAAPAAPSLVEIRSLIRSDSDLEARSYRLSRRVRMRVYIKQLEEVLSESPHVPFTLADMASILNLERTYCCKVFREVAGKSFSDWLSNIRIGYAKTLLLIEGLTVTDISSASGFNDITTFERNFRKRVGVSPRTFRQLNRVARRSEPKTAGTNAAASAAIRPHSDLVEDEEIPRSKHQSIDTIC